MKQCFDFHSIFYKNKDRQSQNNFILRYTQSKPVQRRRPKTNEKNLKTFHTKFFVRKNDNNDMIPVCQNAFLQILQIKRSRVEFATKSFQKYGYVPEETRGGDHVSVKFNDKKQSIVEFISSLACSDVHYCRSKSGRKYLPAELNIVKLHKMYNDKVEENLKVKECYFRYIFNRKFNIGFGSPRLDMCSTCIELKEKMKLEKDPQKQHELLIQRTIHKKRAKAFYRYLKEEEPEVMNVSFDCQKNLPLPKLPDQEVYYRRQLYLYNLTVVKGSSKGKLTKENCTSYVWTEDLHKKGSSEIASCVFHFLNNTDFTGKTKLRLFADGCGGQNKNQIILAMISKWLLNMAPSTIEHIEIMFPIRGHSFMPPDRVFGHCEKQFKTLQQIENPDQYVEIISRFSTVVNVGTDCEVRDWRSEAYAVFKPVSKWHFKFAPTKKFFIKKSLKNKKQVVFKGEHFYAHEVSTYRFLTKSKSNIVVINPTLISPALTGLVKKVKLADVKRLLEIHYGPNWMENTTLKYYKNVFEMCDGHEDNQDEAEPECEEMEESPETIV